MGTDARNLKPGLAMSERFSRLVAVLQERDYGGVIPPEVLEIAQWAELRCLGIIRGKGLHPDVVHTLRLELVELFVRVAREMIFCARNGKPKSHAWRSGGFGSVTERAIEPAPPPGASLRGLRENTPGSSPCRRGRASSPREQD